MPAFGGGVAICMLLGVCACLLLPALPARGGLLAALALGVACWARGGAGRLAGALLLGVGWAGLQAGWALSAQLPARAQARDWRVEGRVIGLPQVEARRTRFDFLADACPAGPEVPCGRRLQLAWYDETDAAAPGPRARLQAGQRWQLLVRLRAPRGLVNPGGFDGERYALARRVAATGYVRAAPLARALGPPTGIDAWRARMSARIAAHAPAGAQRFVRALALGDTGGLDDADWATLRAAGLTHLIAISGFPRRAGRRLRRAARVRPVAPAAAPGPVAAAAGRGRRGGHAVRLRLRAAVRRRAADGAHGADDRRGGAGALRSDGPQARWPRWRWRRWRCCWSIRWRRWWRASG